ncbi:type VII secretion target [Micromonospora sp. NPDC050417]|uniref:type VII secretion target n=1 Tax=Micromonospora sp. NPDC050417 TaxID=3364280 RepID=UPI0037B7560B
MPTPSTPGPDVPGPVGGYRNAPVTAPGFDSPVPDGLGGPLDLPGHLVVDTEALDKAAAAAGEAADEAAGAARLVDSAVDRSGPTPWGDDPGLGQSFGSVFAEPRQALIKAMEELPEVLRDMADKLRQTSRTFVDVEDDATERARSLVEPSPSSKL